MLWLVDWICDRAKGTIKYGFRPPKAALNNISTTSSHQFPGWLRPFLLYRVFLAMFCVVSFAMLHGKT